MLKKWCASQTPDRGQLKMNTNLEASRRRCTKSNNLFRLGYSPRKQQQQKQQHQQKTNKKTQAKANKRIPKQTSKYNKRNQKTNKNNPKYIRKKIKDNKHSKTNILPIFCIKQCVLYRRRINPQCSKQTSTAPAATSMATQQSTNAKI